MADFNIERKLDESLFGMSVEQALKKINVVHISDVKKIWEKRFLNECKNCSFYPGIEGMMQTLYSLGIVFYIITSRSHSTVDYIMESSSVRNFIDGCVAAEDTLLHKPNPAPIIKAVKQINASLDEIIYIGDTHQDYEAAISAGVRFGLAGWNDDAVNNGYFRIFNNPQDIVTMCGGGKNG